CQTKTYDNIGKGKAVGMDVIKTVGDYKGANVVEVIKCYNCKGTCHYAKQCTGKKRVMDSKWFKDKMLLANKEEVGTLNEEEQDFLAHHMKSFDSDCKDELNPTSLFMVDCVDAFDYFDEEATSSASFMEKISPAGPVTTENDVGPYYDTYAL
nr:hypothetical protein [Tanacetum cinerariifolium]